MHYYVVDAFSDEIFGGNQAGICILDSPLKAETMQNIAMENNLAETAFVVRNGEHYDLRWFTPTVEIELCGHATLGSAFILWTFHDKKAQSFEFHTLSGILAATRTGDLIEMNFPVRKFAETEITQDMKNAVGANILTAWNGYNLMLELPDEDAVRKLQPDFAAIRKLTDYHGVIVTARGDSCDFVSRFFAPLMGVDEDPVTGSAHTSLIPFWSKRLGRTDMTARQLSKRGGVLYCKNAGDRVLIAGKARLYLKGEIYL